MKPIKDTDLPKMLAPVAEALAHKSANSSREDMFDRYMVEPYENDDQLKARQKSTFKSTEVSDTVEAIFAEAMEVFMSGDLLAEFAPVSEQDVEAARDETKVIHHLATQQNDSFAWLSTWFKEGLIEQNSYVGSSWVEKKRVRIEEYEELTVEQFFEVYANAQESDSYDIEDLEGATIDGDVFMPVMGEDGQPEPISTRIRCETTEKKYEIEPIPQSEFFISPRWNKATLEGCPAHGHKAQKTRSELIAMGFDAGTINSMTVEGDDEAKSNRHNTETNDDDQGQDNDLLTVCEAYITSDDGKTPRILRCWTDETGKKLLKWDNGKDAIDEVERTRFSSWSPYLVPHRHAGRSVAELATSRQRLNTSLWRNVIDNMVATNNVRPYVDEQQATKTTYDDLLDPRAGAPIRGNGPNGVTWTKPPQIIGDALTLMDRVDGDLEKHAGAVRYAQGLAPNALEKTNIGSQGMGRIMDAGMRRMNIVLRTFAETGLRDLFLRMHADMRRGPSKQLSLQINGDWVETSPIDWIERTDMVVRVGSGRSDREKRLSALQAVLAEQKELLLAGSPMVTPTHIHETYKRMATLLGLQSIEPFMLDPAQIPPAEPADPMADPAMVLAAAEMKKAEADIVEAQTKQTVAVRDIEFKERRLELEAQIAQAKAQEAEAKLQLDAADVGIRRDKVTIDAVKATA